MVTKGLSWDMKVFKFSLRSYRSVQYLLLFYVIIKIGKIVLKFSLFPIKVSRKLLALCLKIIYMVFVFVVSVLNVFLVKKRYYKNENLGLDWDRIGVCQITPLYPTYRMSILLHYRNQTLFSNKDQGTSGNWCKI